MSQIRIGYPTFAPREAARITGLGVDLQRDWRRHGYLPRSEGRASFDIMDLASMAFMQKLAQRDIGPKFTHSLATSVALRIAYFAAQWVDCWEGDVEQIPGETWGEKARRLNPFVPSGGRPARFYVWSADGQQQFCSSIDAFFNGVLSGDPSVAGAVVVMDLEAIAGGLLDAAGKPLLTVTSVADEACA